MRSFWHRLRVNLLIFLVGLPAANAMPLTLKQAESAALLQSPEIKSLQAKTCALKHAAVAAGQLSDPKLLLGTMNVPVDSFDFSQEPMTQIQVGLMQNFPRGRSLHYLSLQKEDLSLAEHRKQHVMRLQILQGVRISWLNLYFWLHAKEIILKQKGIFQHLLKVTESMLANNQLHQKDVIRAQLELTELDNRLLDVAQQIATTRAQLARWIGVGLAKNASPSQIPSWSIPPRIRRIRAAINKHPILKTDEAQISAGCASIKVAEQQYIPGFSVGVAYGFREGRNLDGGRRANFLTAKVTMDLPLLTRNRQDRTLKANINQYHASQEDLNSHYRQLNEALNTQYAVWLQQRKSNRLYRSKLIPEANQYATATMTAYQNTQTDFPTLARAYVRELNTELAGLKASVNQNIARVNLFYLQGR